MVYPVQSMIQYIVIPGFSPRLTLLSLNIVLNGLNFKTHLRHNEKQGAGRF